MKTPNDQDCTGNVSPDESNRDEELQVVPSEPLAHTQNDDQVRDVAPQEMPVKDCFDCSPQTALLSVQLNQVARDNDFAGPERRRKLKRGTLELYADLKPRDAIDSMFARVIVGINN